MKRKRSRPVKAVTVLAAVAKAPAIPPLAGQYAHYIAFQMRMWQMGYRKNDANQQMANIARRLSPQDVEAIGLYFERLPQQDAAKSKRQP